MKQPQIDWFLRQGVPVEALHRPSCIITERRGSNDWLYFYEDDALWQPKSGELVSRTFWCLGTYEPNVSVTIHATPLDWLRASRTGIVVIDWSQAYDNLYRLPRVFLPASLRAKYDDAMRPPALPHIEISE